MTFETASLPLLDEPAEARRAIDDMLGAFEAFKQANDDRLSEIEKRNGADVLLEEKVDRINAQLGALSAQVHRPPVSGAGDDEMEMKAAFEGFVRGHPNASEFKAVANAATGSTHEGFLMPAYLETRLNDTIMSGSAFSRLAARRVLEQNSSLKWVIPADTDKASWADEDAARPSTKAPTITSIDIDMHELYANPAASQRFIDDSGVDVEGWMLQALADSFAASENEAFVSGDGNGKPKGVLRASSSYTKSGSTTVQYLKTGSTRGFAAAKPTDALLNTMFALDAQYRANAVWLFNASVLAEIRKMRDASERYIWSPATNIGEASQIFGHGVYEEANLPDIKAAAGIGLFGDFNRAFTIVQRPDTQLIRDPYSEKPFVQFYATRRVGGGVTDACAVKVLQVAS